MNPCLIRCINCVFSEETNKRLKCIKGIFDVKIVDGILSVPYDFDCVDFTKKEKISNIEKELYEGKEK